MCSRRSFVIAVSLSSPSRRSRDRDVALRGVVERGEQVHQRRLSRARRPHDRGQLRGLDRQRDAAQRVHGRVARAVDAGELVRLDHGAVRGSRPISGHLEVGHGGPRYTTQRHLVCGFRARELVRTGPMAASMQKNACSKPPGRGDPSRRVEILSRWGVDDSERQRDHPVVGVPLRTRSRGGWAVSVQVRSMSGIARRLRHDLRHACPRSGRRCRRGGARRRSGCRSRPGAMSKSGKQTVQVEVNQ